MKQKIAFVHYPHFAHQARLETMPFALHSVEALASMGLSVDLYLWEEPGPQYKALLQDNITIRYFREPRPSPLKELVRHIVFQTQFHGRRNYCCVFGVGQIGVCVAAIIAKANQCPFVYLNDEFPSTWDTSRWGFRRWAKLEKRVVRKAAIVVVPDPTRFHPLCQELEIETSKPHAVLPNTPIVEPPYEKVNWHDRLGIPHDSIPFLHAGSIDDWAQVPELLSSVTYWPEQAVLVLHSRSWKETEIYRRQLSHLEVPGKVFWSRESLSANALNSLVSYCAGNFALYRNTGPNIEYLGFSSGKLMRSLACGCPVIASRFSSLSFIADYRLGILVNHPAEIPDAVKEIMRNREAYKSRCLDFCSAHASFEKAWEKFCEQLRQIVKIDLSRSMS